MMHLDGWLEAGQGVRGGHAAARCDARLWAGRPHLLTAAEAEARRPDLPG